MDDLRPDVDEVRRFQQERAKPVKSKKPAGQEGMPAPDSIPKAKATTNPQAPASFSHRAVGVSGDEKKSNPGKSYFNLLLVLMLICLAVGGGYYVWQQQVIIDQMEENLAYATDYMKQSKLLMARLEGRVYETGSEMEVSGSAVEQKLQFLDSEMRKLWGVAGDTNKKLIAQNQAEISSVQTLTAGLTDALISQDGKIQGQQKMLEALQASLNAKVADIDALQANLAKQVAANAALAKSISDLGGQVKGLDKSLATLSIETKSQVTALGSGLQSVSGTLKSSSTVNPLEPRVKNTEAAIESIDATRRQVNERIVKIERRLNDMQLYVNQLQPADLAPVR